MFTRCLFSCAVQPRDSDQCCAYQFDDDGGDDDGGGDDGNGDDGNGDDGNGDDGYDDDGNDGYIRVATTSSYKCLLLVHCLLAYYHDLDDFDDFCGVHACGDFYEKTSSFFHI